MASTADIGAGRLAPAPPRLIDMGFVPSGFRTGAPGLSALPALKALPARGLAATLNALARGVKPMAALAGGAKKVEAEDEVEVVVGRAVVLESVVAAEAKGVPSLSVGGETEPLVGLVGFALREKDRVTLSPSSLINSLLSSGGSSSGKGAPLAMTCSLLRSSSCSFALLTCSSINLRCLVSSSTSLRCFFWLSAWRASAAGELSTQLMNHPFSVYSREKVSC